MEIVYLPLNFMRELDHELRNPLTGILGLARMLEELSLTPETKNYAQNIIEQSNKLVELADILNHAKSLASPVSIGTLEHVKC